MATYKEIRGSQIEAVATDPSNPVEGQVWYNTTSNVLKGQAATTAGVWASGTAVNQARWLGSSAGTKTAALIAGGEDPSNAPTNNTETWNGSSWTEVNNLNVGKVGMAQMIGTSSSTLAVGGSPNLQTNELWNGTNWTEDADISTGRRYFGGAGADNTAALVFGGASPSVPAANQTESWNGSSWTEVNNLNTGRRNLSGAGVLYTAALGISGGSPLTANVEQWNGTNWTEVNNVNTARGYGGASGSSSEALFYGGDSGSNTGATESWNGTNWTETGDLSSARQGIMCAGTLNTAALGISGYTSTYTAVVEEFTGAGAGQTRTFTDS
tara:strand:- start:39 stop:1016 length:978 start_codon:yes stop_codon:yes gene_type:complete